MNSWQRDSPVRRTISFLLIILLLAVSVSIASAHANLVRSEPAANAILDKAPAQVRLWFSETPEPRFSQVQLFNRAGTQIDGVGLLRVDPSDAKLLSVTLPPLAHGVYTVVWRALSSVDGHVTTGGFAFAIGQEQVPAGGLKPVSLTSGATNPALPAVIGRWLSYLALALLVGGFGFVPLVLQPGLLRTVSRPINLRESGLSRLLIASWLLLLIATIESALWQSASAGGDLLTLLLNTRYGVLFWLRLLLLMLIARLLSARSSRYWWLVGTILGAALLLATSLGSHAAATTEPLIPLIADWFHLLFMSLWIGGLAALLVTLRRIRSLPASTKATAILVSKFSQLATVCVVGLAITGAFQVFYEIGDLANLIDTPYGLALLAKLGLLLPLLGLGALNLLLIRRRLLQAISAADPASAIQPWARLIRRTVTGEIIFVTLILGITGILTNLPPAREAFGSGSVVRGQAADLRVIVAANPGLPGLNTFDIYLRDSLNRSVSEVEKVALFFSMREHDMGQDQGVAVPVDGEAGHFVAQGAYISMIGTWQIELLVRRTGQDDARTTLTLPVVSTVALPTDPILVAPSRLLLGAEIMIISVIALIVLWRVRRLRRIRRWARWAALLVAVTAFAVGLSISATGFATGMQSIPLYEDPVRADSASVARGKQIYVDNCLACHGETGAGDGSVGNALKPLPTNFLADRPATHPDGQLFDWITRGVEGSSMPGFGETLTVLERWDVINYIRSFGGP